MLLLIFFFAVFLIFLSLSDIYDVYFSPHFWDLMIATYGVDITKTMYVIYRIISVVAYSFLFFIAYKFPKYRLFILLIFILCFVLMGYGVLESLLFGFKYD